MRSKSRQTTRQRAAITGLIAFACSAILSAQDTLLSNNFEDDSMGPWSVTGADAGLYEKFDVVSNMTSGVDNLINYAPAGNFCLWNGRGGDHNVLTNPLPLASRGYTSVTVAYSYNCRNASGTRRLNLDYSPDNGTTWTTVGTFVTGSGSTTRTVTSNLTDQAKFRFTFADSGGAAGPFFIDDIVITASPEFNGNYWDSDGAAAGAGATPTGTWGVDNFWSTSPDGDVATGAWTPGEVAVFSAGADATGGYTVTVDSTQAIGGLAFFDGTPTLTGGTLRMTSDSYAYVDSGRTATIASDLSDDATPRLFSRNGKGTLILSGNNATATGGMALNDGVTRFESSGAINGTTRNLTINTSGVLAFGSSFGSAAIQTALNDRVVTFSAGTVAADNNAAVDFNFGTSGLASAFFGAVGSVSYAGTLTPNGTTYRLGGAGGTLILNSALTTGHALTVRGPGTIRLNGFDATMGDFNTIGNPVIENGSATTNITLSVSPTGTRTFSGTLQDGSTGTLRLVKNGSQTLNFSNSSNSFSGGLVLNGGTVGVGGSVDPLGAPSSTITVQSNSTLNQASSGAITLNKSIVLDGSAVLTWIHGNNAWTVTGPVTGTGGMKVNDAGSVFQRTLGLTSTSNTFTGAIDLTNNKATIALNSLLDTTSGSGNIVFDDSEAYFGLNTGTAVPITLNHRRIQITTGGGTARIGNANATAANNLTIIPDLLVTAPSGISTLRLEGANNGNNTFAGVIAKGALGTLNLTKADGGRWILSNVNTYNGITDVTAGTLIGTNATQSFGTNLSGINIAGAGTLSLRNDDSVSFTNGTSAYNIANSASGATINVDRVSGTGSNVITVGNLTTTSTAGAWGLNFTGANGVSLSAGALNTPVSTIAATHTITNNIAGGGSLTLASVFNQATTIASPDLVFAGTGNTTVTGAITQTQSTMDLLKSGGGTLTLNGANTYAGGTTSTAGTLIINGDQSLATGLVDVRTGSVLGGTGTIGGNVTVEATSGLAFKLSTAPGSHDKLDVLGTFTFEPGSHPLAITSSGGATTGLYTLITSVGDMTGPFPTVTLPNDWTSDPPQIVGKSLVINITSTGAVPTPYEAWAASFVPNPGALGLNPDFDLFTNQLEFAFGTNPNVSDNSALSWAGGMALALPGGPAVEVSFPGGGGVDFKARFMRRKDHGTAGSVSYAWEFSSDLTDWEASDDAPAPIWFVAPTDLADDASGDYDLVEVPYPLILDNGKKARFFRVSVTAL